MRCATVAAGALVLAATACGSTVQMNGASNLTSGSGGGLSAPTGSGQPGAAGGQSLGDGGSGTPATSGGATGSSAGGSGPGAGSSAGPGSTAGAGAAAHGTRTTPGGGATSAGTRSTTGPISIGFVITKVSNASAFGVSLGNTVNEQDVDQALVDAVNAHGGIAHRRIEPVYASTDTATTNWSQDFQAACSTFTQDHHVAAVLGYNFTYEANFESCLARAGIPHLSDGFNVPSRTVLSAYPLFRALDVPTIEARSIAKLSGAVSTGVLGTSSKLGILTDTCPGSQEALNRHVLPFLKAHKVPTVSPYTFGCADGANADQAAEINNVSGALLRFRSEGVDRITIISVSEAGPLLLATEAAQSQNYHPDWIVTSLATLAVQQGQAPADQLKNVHGFGWLPSQDVSPALQPRPNRAQARCLSLLRSRGVQPKSATDFGYAYNVCEAVFLYADALTATHGSAVGGGIDAAISRLGRHFQSTLNLTGQSDHSAARRDDAPQVYRPVNYADSCGCFKYFGSTYRMP